MKFGSLVVCCACLVLLSLEVEAARFPHRYGPNKVSTIEEPTEEDVPSVTYHNSQKSSWGQPLPPMSQTQSLFSIPFLIQMPNPPNLNDFNSNKLWLPETTTRRTVVPLGQPLPPMSQTQSLFSIPFLIKMPNPPNLSDFNSNELRLPKATTQRTVVPLPTLAHSRKDTVINDYLKKINVTTSDIMKNNGKCVLKIIDTNGRILYAKFEMIDTKRKGVNRKI